VPRNGSTTVQGRHPDSILTEILSVFLLGIETRHHYRASLRLFRPFSPLFFFLKVSLPSKIWLLLTLAFHLFKAHHHNLILFPYSVLLLHFSFHTVTPLSLNFKTTHVILMCHLLFYHSLCLQVTRTSNLLHKYQTQHISRF